ncbi:MAG: hypothetical protein ACFFAO_10540 [Candidatus Hermodarchaeota archaeon]
MQISEESVYDDFCFKMYIDYDKKNQIFYHNFYFDEYKFVLKIALIPPLNGEFGIFNNDKKYVFGNNSFDLKLEKFDLTKYVYLLYYE